MISYQTSLKAALRARGASEDLVASAMESIGWPAENQSLEEYEALVREFGEPGTYAAQLMPENRGKPRLPFMLTAMVLAVIALFAMPIEQYGWWKPLIVLGLLVAGILIEFVRYTQTGKR